MAVTRPGPKAEFTERFLVQLKPEQRQALDDIAAAFQTSTSHIVRWFLDQGIDACQSVPTFKSLPRRPR